MNLTLSNSGNLYAQSKETGLEEMFAIFSEEEVVISALKRPQTVSKSPAIMSVIMARQIKQMGFRTLAVQKRSSEVWDILKAVKFEFKEFSGVLAKAHKQIDTASTTLEKLRTTRTNVLERKLKDVETFTAIEAKEVLELSDNEIVEE